MARKKLPTGIQSFREIREEGMYYVDKTGYAKQLIDGDKHNFLSRPRRFGKSLFVDTLKNLFEGKEKLFRGLYIHDKWDWTKEYPVLRFSFGKGTFEIPGYLERNLAGQLGALERGWKMESDIPDAPDRLAYLIERLVKETGQRVVILVDEYDKPIFETLGTPELAEANRAYLRGFYATIKDCDDDIKFSFLTGVSKFAHAGIFSGLNNLNDITLDPEFSSICGYTDHDIDTVFAKVLGDLDREKIKEWYDGYNWCGPENVYNPFSILKLLGRRKFRSWWFPTGTPTFLVNELKQSGGIDTLRLAGMSAGDELLSSFDIGDMEAPALLFQTGYLTIAGEDEGEDETLYLMDFPNREVRQSLFRRLLRALAPKARVSKQAKQIHDALLSSDLDAVEAQLHATFADIPHQFYKKNKLAYYEGHYANVVYSALMGTGLPVQAESSTNLGDIDMVVETDAHIYVFELKVLKGNTKPGDAMKQIHERGYADKYRARGVQLHLIGVEFSTKKRNIENFDIETIQARRPSGRKKSSRKKTARKKTARKKTARKKTARKKTARKKGARKKGARKKGARKKSSRRKSARKKSTRKKSTRKKSTRKKSTRKKITRKKSARKKRSPRR